MSFETHMPLTLYTQLFLGSFGVIDHSLQSDVCEMLGLVVNNDLVNDIAVDEIFHRPREILRRDAVHRRAHAEVGSE